MPATVRKLLRLVERVAHVLERIVPVRRVAMLIDLTARTTLSLPAERCAWNTSGLVQNVRHDGLLPERQL